LRAAGIEALDLFGSVARGEAGPDSHVDLACRIADKAVVTLLNFAGLQMQLEDLLQRPVDLVERHMLKGRLRQHAEPDMIPVFE